MLIPYYFDCETSADIPRAKALLPEFDAAEIKVGNLKDPDKIREKIESARATHEADWLAKAALRPEVAICLAIGIQHGDETTILHVNGCCGTGGGESSMLSMFWQMLEDSIVHSSRWIGYNCKNFDLPFLTIRSRILGVRVPANLRHGRYWNDTFIDLMEEWLMGRNRLETKCSLGYVARALGVGEKSGDGKDFAATYAQDEAKALAYLRNDIALTAGVGAKLGF